MFFLSNPSDAQILAVLADLSDAPFTHVEVGSTEQDLVRAPPGFTLDRYGTELGRGRDVFERACAALSRIENYPPSFTRIVRQPGELAPGRMFATIASHPGFYSAHPCRVLYVMREEQRFGFGFGTLPGHAESGEERFMITFDGEQVRYEIQAFSRPHGLLSRLAAPISRAYQLRFQRETLATMVALARG